MKRLSSYKDSNRIVTNPDERQFLILLGQAFLALRTAEKLSQENVAELSGIGRRTIIKIENGQTNVRIVTLWRLCQFYKIAMSYLFSSLPAMEITKPSQNKTEK